MFRPGRRRTTSPATSEGQTVSHSENSLTPVLSPDFALSATIQLMASSDPLQKRDAGLRRLVLAKRLIIAASVTLTGVLAAIAANAFPGKQLKTTASALR